MSDGFDFGTDAAPLGVDLPTGVRFAGGMLGPSGWSGDDHPTRDDLNALLRLAEDGIAEIIDAQQKMVAEPPAPRTR